MKPRRPFEWAELAELRALAAMDRTPRGALKAAARRYGRSYWSAGRKVFNLRLAIKNPPQPVARGAETHAQLITRLKAEHEAAAR